MTVYFGFYNSSSGDREYDAIDFSKLFDGLINDGIFASQGDKFIVVEDTPASMDVVVGSGRAWFNHTWTLNDADLDVTVPTAHATLNRIDIVYLEVDESTRTNSIDIVSGTPATTPVAPTLTQTSTVHQYALAHIYVGAAATSIGQEDITNKIGLSATPFVTGIIDQVNVEELLLEWQAEWDTWFDAIKDQLSTEAETNLQNQIWAIVGDINPPLTDLIEVNSHDHSGEYTQIPLGGLAANSVDDTKIVDDSVDESKVGNGVLIGQKRQGGHSTYWHQYGTTDYTIIDKVLIQMGSARWQGPNASSGYVNVNLPISYGVDSNLIPLIFITLQEYSDTSPLDIICAQGYNPPTSSGFSIKWRSITGSLYSGMLFHWMTIGAAP